MILSCYNQARNEVVKWFFPVTIRQETKWWNDSSQLQSGKKRSGEVILPRYSQARNEVVKWFFPFTIRQEMKWWNDSSLLQSSKKQSGEMILPCYNQARNEAVKWFFPVTFRQETKRVHTFPWMPLVFQYLNSNKFTNPFLRNLFLHLRCSFCNNRTLVSETRTVLVARKEKYIFLWNFEYSGSSC